MPLTKFERRQAVRRLLAERPELSHRAIGRLVGVSHDTVGRWGKEVDDSSTPDDGAPASTGTPPTADEAARRLVSTLIRLDGDRGLLDMMMPARMGRHLADAFEARLGDDALKQARRVAQWSAASVTVLEGRTG